MAVRISDVEPEDPVDLVIEVPVVPDDAIQQEEEQPAETDKPLELTEEAKINNKAKTKDKDKDKDKDNDKATDKDKDKDKNKDKDKDNHKDKAESKDSQPDTTLVDEGDASDTVTDVVADGVVDTEITVEEPKGELPENAVDMDVYKTIGRVLLFKMITLPASPITCKKWTLREIVSSDVLRTKIDYPFADAPKVADPSDPEKTIAATAGLAPWDPIAISIPMWSGLEVAPDLKMAWWDATTNIWYDDGFSDVSIDKETNMLSFKTNHIAPTTLIQRKDLLLFLRDWELRPINKSTVSLTLSGNMDFVFHICEKGVQLKSPVFTQAERLSTEWLAPDVFVNEMLQANINCFSGLQPAKGKSSSVPVCEKELELEASVYRQMGVLSSSCLFRESIWNKELNSEQFMMLVKDVAVPDHRWTGMFVDGYKSAFVPVTEEHSETFVNEANKDVKMYGTLYHAVGAMLGEERFIDAQKTNTATAFAVTYLLAAVRPFSYSNADEAKKYQASERVRVAAEDAKRKEEEEAAAAEALAIEVARIAAELAANPPKKKKK